jgi:diamine oxidase
VRPSGGLRLWDIQFGGERIIFELSLQEAMISFGGTTPSQARRSSLSASLFWQIEWRDAGRGP